MYSSNEDRTVSEASMTGASGTTAGAGAARYPAMLETGASRYPAMLETGAASASTGPAAGSTISVSSECSISVMSMHSGAVSASRSSMCDS